MSDQEQKEVPVENNENQEEERPQRNRRNNNRRGGNSRRGGRGGRRGGRGGSKFVTTQSKYERQPKEKQEQLPDNEVRLTGRGNVGMYVSRVATCLLREEEPFTTVVLKGTGNAISKAVGTSNIIRNKIKGLHMETKIYSIDTTDVYLPLEEGLDTVVDKRQLICVDIILTTNVEDVDVNGMGYQEPLNDDDVEVSTLEEITTRRNNRTGGRGGNRSNGPRPKQMCFKFRDDGECTHENCRFHPCCETNGQLERQQENGGRRQNNRGGNRRNQNREQKPRPKQQCFNFRDNGECDYENCRFHPCCESNGQLEQQKERDENRGSRGGNRNGGNRNRRNSGGRRNNNRRRRNDYDSSDDEDYNRGGRRNGGGRRNNDRRSRQPRAPQPCFTFRDEGECTRENCRFAPCCETNGYNGGDDRRRSGRNERRAPREPREPQPCFTFRDEGECTRENCRFAPCCESNGNNGGDRRERKPREKQMCFTFRDEGECTREYCRFHPCCETNGNNGGDDRRQNNRRNGGRRGGSRNRRRRDDSGSDDEEYNRGSRNRRNGGRRNNDRRERQPREKQMCFSMRDNGSCDYENCRFHPCCETNGNQGGNRRNDRNEDEQ